MKLLRMLAGARADLREIHHHLEQIFEDYRTADSVIEQLVQQCERLAELSGTMGRPRPEFGTDIRSFPFRGYVIFFRYVGDELHVIRIVSGRRDLETTLADDD
jgi:plasmid stabilization system protein ParE